MINQQFISHTIGYYLVYFVGQHLIFNGKKIKKITHKHLQKLKGK